MRVDVVNTDNRVVGEVELPEAIFAAKINIPLMHQVVLMQLAKRRRGTASTKTRHEVSGTTRKPWRQKGTGRARAGNNKSPLWVRGGAVFGPHPRDYSFRVPKKMRRLALKSALSAKLADGELLVVDHLGFEKPATRELARVLERMKLSGRILIVDESRDENLYLSARNLPKVKVLPVAGLNVYDILAADRLMILQRALPAISARLMQNGSSASN